MDPFSLATGVVGLAQAIVELVNLAQSLKASFAKVSDNRKNAKALVSEILESVQFIQKFYEKHCAPNEGTDVEILCSLILELRNALSSALLQCAALIPQAEQGRASRTKVSFQSLRAWLKRDEIESQIKELRALVDRSTLKFVAYATMDSSVTTKATYATAIRLESKTSEIHQRVVVRRQRQEAVEASRPTPAIEASEGRQTFITNYRQQSINIKHLPLTGEQATDLFLRTQVVNIDQLLSRIVATKSIYVRRATNSVSRWEISLMIAPIADYETMQQRVAIQTCEIFDFLKKHETLSPKAFLDISNQLERTASQYRSLLKLPREGSILQSWCLRLLREACKVNPSLYGPSSARALTNHATALLECGRGELGKATASIAEAVALHSAALAEDPSNMHKKIYLARALRLSSEASRMAGDYERAREDTREGIEILQEVVAAGYGTHVIDEITLDPRSFTGTRFYHQVRSAQWRVTALISYGSALQEAFRVTAVPQEALKAADSARKVYLKLHQHLPGAFSSILFHMAKEIVTNPVYKVLVQGEEAQKYLDEAFTHLGFVPSRTDDITQDLDKYTIHMGRALSFCNSGRFDDAAEASNLAAIHLERCTEILRAQAADTCTFPKHRLLTIALAVLKEQNLVMEIEGKAQLWCDSEGVISTHRLNFVRGGEQSIHSRLKAIGRLVDKIAVKAQPDSKPLTDMEYRFCLSLGFVLSGALSRLQKFDEAYHFAQHVHQLIQHASERYWHPDPRNHSDRLFLVLLRASTDSASRFRKEPQAVTWAEGAIAVANKIAPNPTPDQWDDIYAMFLTHCIVLETHDRPTEALEMWKKHSKRYRQLKPGDPKGVRSALRFTVGLAQNHLQAGRLSTALDEISPITQSILIMARPESTGRADLVLNGRHVGVVALHVTILQQLGRIDEALELLDKTIDRHPHGASGEHREAAKVYAAVDNPTKTDDNTLIPDASNGGSNDEIDGPSESRAPSELAVTNGASEACGRPGCVWGLPFFCLKAFLLSRKGKHDEGVAAASWALRTLKPPSYDTKGDWLMATLCVGMWLNLSNTFTDAGSLPTAMDHAHNAKQVFATLATKTPIDPFLDFCVLPARIDYALALASSLLQDGHLEDASELLLEQVDICKLNVNRRRELYPPYALAMRLLGLYYCSIGDHSEGIRWRKKVVGLEYTLPEGDDRVSEMFGVVKRRMIWEESRPSTLRLKEALNITCTHQGPVFQD